MMEEMRCLEDRYRIQEIVNQYLEELASSGRTKLERRDILKRLFKKYDCPDMKIRRSLLFLLQLLFHASIEQSLYIGDKLKEMVQ
jgi:hypothetical protein